MPFNLIVASLLWLAFGVEAQPMAVRTLSQAGYSGKFNVYNSERPGMMVEMMRAIEQMDAGVRFTGLEQAAPMARAEVELEKGTIDAFFGMAKTEVRDAKYLFIVPVLYQTAYQLAARADDQAHVTSLEDVHALGLDSVILINADETNSDFLKSQGDLILDASAINTILNLKKLTMKRGRFYFASSLSLSSEIRELGLDKTIKILPPKFQQSNIYAVFSRTAPLHMVERIATDLGVLEKKGELNRIRKKYMDIR